MYVDIYLYTDGVGVDCGAFSCSCGGAGGLRCCVYGYIKACSVWCVGVVISMYLYNVLVACMVVVWWWSACVYMDRYIYIMVVCSCFALVCIYKMKCCIQKPNNFHA